MFEYKTNKHGKTQFVCFSFYGYGMISPSPEAVYINDSNKTDLKLYHLT